MERIRAAIRKIRIVAAATGTSLAVCAVAASPAAATCTHNHLISHATVAKILGLPHVARGEGCTDEAWSGRRPSLKQEAAAEKNGTFAVLESFFWSTHPGNEASLATREHLRTREGREITSLGGTHRAFQPSMFGAEFARANQGKGHLDYVKATWWSPNKATLVYVAIYGGKAKTFAQGRVEMNKLGAVIVPAANAVPPAASISPGE